MRSIITFDRYAIRSGSRLGMLVAFLFFGGWEPGYCATPLPNYVIHIWRAESGLPQNAVSALAQTRDGYIWVGTSDGLARFDGVRFTVFDSGNTPGMSSSRITSLFEAEDGVLWIGEEDGSLTRLSHGRFELVDFRSASNHRSIIYIGSDEAHDIWVVSQDGLMTRLKDGLTYYPQPVGVMSALNVAVQPGHFWISRSHQVWTLREGELLSVPFNEVPSKYYVQGMCPASTGGLWLAYDSSLRQWDGSKWVGDLEKPPWGRLPLTAMAETHSGLIVAGTRGNGLYLMARSGGVTHLARTNGLPSDWVTSIVEDREQNIWVGTCAGLVMLHATSIATVNPPDQWQGFPLLSVSSGADGEIWAATAGSGVYRLKDGVWTHYGRESGLFNQYVWSISQDSEGRTWAGTWGNGVFLLGPDGFRRPDGLNLNLPVLAILHEPGDVNWVGTSVGLAKYHAGKAEWSVQEPLMTTRDVRCILRDRDGALWLGMFGGGLARVHGDQFRQYRKSDGLPSDFVQCMRLDSDGAIWIGTFGGGLARMKQGRFAVVDRHQGLPHNDIGDIEEDHRGSFWISSHAGIFRVGKADLNRCADGLDSQVRFQLFTVSDGLPSVECAAGGQPAGSQSQDGRLWFPTSMGLVSIDPDAVHRNRLPPPVAIEKVLVDDQEQLDFPTPPAVLRIPPGHHRLEIQYTALSYSAPERVRFKYRLRGLDRDWVNADNKRVADYSYLPPGTYAFQVIACNNDSVWNETGAGLQLKVLPYVWQTSWFRFLGGAAALGAVGGLAWLDARRRMRRKLEKLERQQAVEQERARIAHDIHDDVGAHLTRITLLCDPGRNASRNPHEAAKGLTQVYETARELVQAMDEIVWAVNPRNDTLDSLIDYLHRYAQEFFEPSTIRCHLDVPLESCPLQVSAETRHNLFLAFKETLNNIVKHSKASEVHVQLVMESGRFELSIADNGGGFNSQAANGNSKAPEFLDRNGLKNMDRRMRAVGGFCQLRSTPGKGTTVRFSVPLHSESMSH